VADLRLLRPPTVLAAPLVVVPFRCEIISQQVARNPDDRAALAFSFQLRVNRTYELLPNAP